MSMKYQHAIYQKQSKQSTDVLKILQIFKILQISLQVVYCSYYIIGGWKKANFPNTLLQWKYLLSPEALKLEQKDPVSLFKCNIIICHVLITNKIFTCSHIILHTSTPDISQKMLEYKAFIVPDSQILKRENLTTFCWNLHSQSLT